MNTLSISKEIMEQQKTACAEGNLAAQSLIKSAIFYEAALHEWDFSIAEDVEDFADRIISWIPTKTKN